jgi:hypothetical protein
MPELGTSGSVRGRDGQPPGLLDHMPTDLVVAKEASAVQSSPRLDFLLRHNLGTRFVAL